MRIYLQTDWSGRIDVTERVQRWNFRSLTPGGWWDAQITLNAPRRDLWELINSWPGGALTFHLRGQDVWRGRLSGARLQGDALTISAEGAARELLDAELWRVYADAGYEDWDAEPDAERAFEIDNNNRVYVGINRGVIYDAGAEGAITYPDDYQLGGDIVRVQATPEVVIETGAWIAELRDDAGNIVWSTTTATTTAFDVAVANASALSLTLRATETVNAAPASEEDDIDVHVRLTQVVLRTLDDAGSDAVVTDILAAAGIDAVISDSGVDVDRAVYQRSSQMAALADMAELGDGEASWVFVIYDDEAEFRPWANSADWMITPDDAPAWNLEWRLRDVINAVRAQLPDGWLSDWYTDDESIAYYGTRRERTLRLPMTTRAEAARLAQVYLADHAWARAALRIDAGAWIHKPDGSRFPAAYIRAGDTITLRDLIPDSDELIQVQEVVVNDGGISITPVGASSRLDVILAARDRAR